MKLFAGFPYFATQIEGPMQHLMPVPETHDEDRLVELLRGQVEANRLPTALVLSEDRAIYLEPDLGETHEGIAPFSTLPVIDRLLPRNAFHRTPAFKKRERELRKWVRETGARSGYFVARRPYGEPALKGEEEWLGGTQLGGAPMGLDRCTTCGDWRGKCIDDLAQRAMVPSSRGDGKLALQPPSIIDVHCRCENWNRCAACGDSLNPEGYRVRGFFYEAGKVWHVPGFRAFAHVTDGHCRQAPRRWKKKQQRNRKRRRGAA